VGGVIVGILVLIIILGLLPGGDEEEPATAPDRGKAARSDDKGGGKDAKPGGGESKLKPVSAVLTARSDVSVCLVGDGDDALIDGQQFQDGDREEFDGYKTYRLDLGPGRVDFEVGSKKETIEVDENTSIEGDADGIRQVEFRGPDCP
jgi:hypothetical protein